MSRPRSSPRFTRPFLVGLVVGLLLLGGLVGSLVLLDRVAAEDGAAGGSGGGGELSLPEEVDGMPAIDAREGDPTAEQAREDYAYHDEQLSEALDGAATASRIYATEDGSRAVRVVAYRADAGPLLPNVFEDPADTQANVVQQLDEHGEVACLVNRTTEAGAQLSAQQGGSGEAGEVMGALCRRTSEDLTVSAELQGVPPEEGAALLDEVYADLE